VGIHPFGRYPDKRGINPSLSFEEIGRNAVAKPWKDAKIDLKDIGAAYCSTMIGPTAAGHKILAPFALRDAYCQYQNACAAGELVSGWP